MMNATVRTFRAPNAASALQAVKAALGNEAVILATREVNGGIFKHPEVEITAALSDELEDIKKSAASPKPILAPATTQVSTEQPINKSTYQGSAFAPARYNDRDDEDSILVSEVRSLKRELDEARREMRVVCLRTRAERDLDLNPLAAEVFGRLVNQGVEDALAEEMVRQAMVDTNLSQNIYSCVRDLLAGRLIPSRPPWKSDHRRVIAMVGPTGVGKTTTIAKVAAKALVESHLRVALITVDTYRIGASEQISRYGAIMRVPTYIARDKAELAMAIEQCVDADLVLIDTAGRAVSEAVARQAELIRTVPGVQLYLVLSAATGSRELAVAAERYRRLAPERLVFSKIDEACAPGSILSAAVRLSRPVACIADGQRVPEDIHAVSSDELCTLVLGNWEQSRADRTVRRR